MADNYLERKMEELRSGKSASARARRTPSGARAGHLDLKFPPRRVVVTGGASGIGRAIVKAYADAGCRTAFFDVDTDAGTDTARATGSRFIPLDLRDAAMFQSRLEELLHEWGDIDIIINNAGVANFSPIEQTTVEEFDDVLAVNLRPAFVAARTLALHRRGLVVPNPYGRIINVASTRAFQSEMGTEAYSASKGALMALTHALMMSLSPYGITVNSISPGWIETGDYDRLSAADHSQHPSGRVGRPDDVARLCLMLSLPDNDFINGENIVVDGGMTRRMIYAE